MAQPGLNPRPQPVAPTHGQALISARALTKTFGRFTAVQDVSIEARTGDVIGLLGPNGAGKTTTIRMLTTIQEPTSGDFEIAGIPSSQPRDIRAVVGVLPESAGFPKSQSGEEYLRYHARLYGLDGQTAKRTAAALLDEVGLAARAKSRIGTYSRGMRQRLGVARALVNTPRVIFLDEPTLGLDPAGQRQMLGLIREVAQQRGAVVVLSTHALDEVEAVCSRAVILNRGRVIIQGSIEEIRSHAAPTGATLRVPSDRLDEAMDLVRQVPYVASADPVDESRGTFAATFEPPMPGSAERSLNDILGPLVAASIPVQSADLSGSRLSDAFLTLTEEK